MSLQTPLNMNSHDQQITETTTKSMKYYKIEPLIDFMDFQYKVEKSVTYMCIYLKCYPFL